MEVFVEMHCHILPGVDDGARTMDEALELLRMEAAQGVRQVILTPHYRMGYFETPREEIRKIYQKLCGRVSCEGIPVTCYLGCELHKTADILQFLEQDPGFRMADTSYVLLEFSGNDTFHTIRNYTAGLLNNGYRPVLAHIERYRELDTERVQELIELGACMQVNAESVMGRNGWKARRFCHRLLKLDRVHFVGSDAHDSKKRPPCLGICAAYLKKKFGTEQTMRLLSENPQKLLKNEYI